MLAAWTRSLPPPVAWPGPSTPTCCGDRPGPRYTSYPTAPHFHDGFDAPALRQAIADSNQLARALSLYVHVPFCSSPCFYCGCNRVITRDRGRGHSYVARVLAEADLLAPQFEDGRESSSCIWAVVRRTSSRPRR